MRRAVICIGVDRPENMTPLHAAAAGAIKFESWALSQGCETVLLIDHKTKVTVNDIFDAVTGYVEKGVYDQLIIYFSGHGILTAPGTEYWLLSRAPQNPNEAVNLFRSVEDARNSGISNVVFVSDACRSSVQGPPLSGISGGSIFPNRHIGLKSAEIDVFYATRPGDPAWEVPEKEATEGFSGIFTSCLLKELNNPSSLIWEDSTDKDSIRIATSRSLKLHLTSIVQQTAALVDTKLHQQPELRVESALPVYFALGNILPTPSTGGIPISRIPNSSEELIPLEENPERQIDKPLHLFPNITFEIALKSINPMKSSLISSKDEIELGLIFAKKFGLSQQVNKILASVGRNKFETRTGFTIYGKKIFSLAAHNWKHEVFTDIDNTDSYHIRLTSLVGDKTGYSNKSTSIVIGFVDGIGTALPILPGFVGVIIVESNRVTSVNYIPSIDTDRYIDYQMKAADIEKVKAFAAVATQNGRFVVESEDDAITLAEQIRQFKGIDPTLGLYAAYSYAQAGKYKDVYSVFNYMNNDRDVPLLFDVVMLATRYEKNLTIEQDRLGSYLPMLAQGWSLLSPGDPLHRSIHERLRPHLIPALWTTLDQEGVSIASEAILTQAEP